MIRLEFPSHEIEPVEPFTISHSQLGVWNDCQVRWKYNYLDRIVPATGSKNYELGTLFHELTAIYDQLVMLGLPVGDPLTWERVAKYAEEEFFTDPNFHNNIQLYNTAIQATKRYILEFSKEVDRDIKFLGVEDEFIVERVTPSGRPFRILGFIDRKQLEGRKIYLLDRKTNGQGRHFSENELLMDPQLLLYAACYRELGEPIAGVLIDSVSTYNYSDYSAQPIHKIMKRLHSYRSDHEQSFILNYVGNVVDDILEHVERNVFTRSLSRACARCAYMEPCLYSMKGIDPEYLLAANFKQKTERAERDPAKLQRLISKPTIQ